MQQIEWEDFQRVELRVGTVLSAVVNEKAVKPAYVLQVDLGELGIKPRPLGLFLDKWMLRYRKHGRFGLGQPSAS